MSIIMSELNPHNYPVDLEIQTNLETLLTRINLVRDDWGNPMIVTSGLRDMAHQKKLIQQGKSTALKSNHLIGAAVDIYDPNAMLYWWIRDQTQTPEQEDDWIRKYTLWLEHRLGAWLHFQIFPPASGNLWFFP